MKITTAWASHPVRDENRKPFLISAYDESLSDGDFPQSFIDEVIDFISTGHDVRLMDITIDSGAVDSLFTVHPQVSGETSPYSGPPLEKEEEND